MKYILEIDGVGPDHSVDICLRTKPGYEYAYIRTDGTKRPC